MIHNKDKSVCLSMVESSKRIMFTHTLLRIAETYHFPIKSLQIIDKDLTLAGSPSP